MFDIPATMRTAILRDYTGPQALELVERPVPQPGPGEVLVKITAAPINPSDQMFLEGRYGLKRALPTPVGFEGAGIVVATGDDVRTRLLLGRRVAFAANERSGSWAEYSLSNLTGCFPLLPGVSTLQGAMLLVNPLTAWALVDIARQHSPAFVQTAAAGALGMMIQRLARRWHMPLINIVRRPEQRVFLENDGADYVLDTSDPDFDSQLRELSRSLKAKIVLEAVAGELTERVLQSMPRGSEAIVYGALSREAISLHPGSLIFRNQHVRGFWLSSWLGHVDAGKLLRAGIAVQRLLSSDFASPVRACLPLEQIQRALELYAKDMTGGKVLILPNKCWL